MLNELSSIFAKDLTRLREEVIQYPGEESLWAITPGINNSSGNLTLHICGNLQHFIGAVLGKSGYVRDRSNEFEAKGISKSTLQDLIDTTETVVAQTLVKLNRNDLEAGYPIKAAFGPKDMTTLQALIILSAHLNYHLGQINYHRRLLS